MIIAFSIYTGLQTNTYEYNYRLLYMIAVLSTLWYAFLYLYSLTISQSFIGAPLWYGDGVRYSGGATNPHQVGTLFAVIIFILLKDLILRKCFIQNCILIITDLFLLLETKASTGIASVFVAAVSLILVILPYLKDQEKKLEMLSIEVTAIALICILFFNPLLNLFINFIESDANGEGRFELFRHIVDVIRKSPIFGLGPGVHSIENGKMTEFHNTYIEIYAAAGIIGVVGLIIFIYKLFKDLKYDILSVPIVVSLLIYACAGFTMRRLIFWGIIIIVIVTAQAKYNGEVNGSCEEKR